jgi:hypothetical protein
MRPLRRMSRQNITHQLRGLKLFERASGSVRLRGMREGGTKGGQPFGKPLHARLIILMLTAPARLINTQWRSKRFWRQASHF